MDPVTQQAFFLTAKGRALAATCFTPEEVCGAVLFLLPFVEERKGALPVFVQTARLLARHHIASLIFDFEGCGDSEGAFDAVQPETFESDAETAWLWLARRFPDRPRALLGLRTGALLAARLASRHPEAAASALWSPVSGADFTRQLFQRRMVNDMVAYGKAQESRAALEARLRGGETVDLDGYPMTGAFHDWLQRLAPAQIGPRPVYVASGGHDQKTAAACAALCPSAQLSAQRYPPFWNTVGHVDLAALIGETAVWLAQQLDRVPSPVPPAAADLAITPTGELLSVASGQTALALIVDRPAGAPSAGVLFLHGWSGDRTGPHRLFTRFARHLAEQGCLCVRPDFTGRGLSGGDAASATIARMTEDAQASLEVLRRRLPPGTPVFAVAICSGCKIAITLAARNPEIARLLLWSAESMGSLRSSATGLRKTLSALATYARKLARPETWKKILRGRVQTGLVTKALVKHETRSAEEAARENDILKQFKLFRNPVHFVFGGSDPDAAGSGQTYARYCRAHRIPFGMDLIPHAGHSYYGEAWTAELFRISLAFLSPSRLPAEGEASQR